MAWMFLFIHENMSGSDDTLPKSTIIWGRKVPIKLSPFFLFFNFD